LETLKSLTPDQTPKDCQQDAAAQETRADRREQVKMEEQSTDEIEERHRRCRERKTESVSRRTENSIEA
jgi:hypothetical protein